MTMKKAFTFFLALLLIVVFCSCDNGDTSGVQSQTTSTAANESTEENDTYVKLDKYFEDGKVTIFGKPDGKHTYSRYQWEYDEELLGEAINDAVFNRNSWISENYGIEIVYLADETPNAYFITEAVQIAVNSNLDAYDIVCDGLTAITPLAQEGYLYEFSELDGIDLDKPWWDDSVTTALSILNKTFFAAGDALITDDEYTYCVIFNKAMYADYELSSVSGASTMYELVDEGEWTYDKMHEMALTVSRELDSDSTMTKSDQWGIISDIGCIYVMMAAADYSMSGLENGVPFLQVQSERSVSLFSKVSAFMNDSRCSLFAERIGGNSYYKDAEDIFGEGRALFSVQKINGVNNFASKFDVDFGISPLPKENSEQENYYNPAAYLHFSVLAVPSINSRNLEATCVALEALAALGRDSLTPAYIETTLKLKKLQDDNDSRMIDLIINNRTFDLATVYNWGELNAFYNKFAGSGNTEIISAWQAIEQAANIAMQETIEVFEKLDS